MLVAYDYKGENEANEKGMYGFNQNFEFTSTMTHTYLT